MWKTHIFSKYPLKYSYLTYHTSYLPNIPHQKCHILLNYLFEMFIPYLPQFISFWNTQFILFWTPILIYSYLTELSSYLTDHSSYLPYHNSYIIMKPKTHTLLTTVHTFPTSPVRITLSKLWLRITTNIHIKVILCT